MNTEQLLLQKQRSLPPDEQPEAINFVEFLKSKQAATTEYVAEPKT